MSLSYIYFALAGENRVLTGILDSETGRIDFGSAAETQWGPEAMAIDPEGRFLFVGCHPRHESADDPPRACKLYAFRIDRDSGNLIPINNVTLEYAPTYLSVDKNSRFLLSAYYRAGKAAVHRIGENGEIGEATQWFDSGGGAHSIQVDASNRFAYLPHVSTSKVNINTWAPVLSANHILPSASNTILQFKFAENGKLLPNTPFKIPGERGGGPRHLCFHPKLDILYFSNEQGCAVSVYTVNTADGTLSPLQYISTLPAQGFDGYASCSSLRLSNSGRFLYVLNRGYDSIACFAVNPDAGKLTQIEIIPTEPQCHTLGIDLDDKYLFAAGHKSGRLMTYRILADGRLEQIKAQHLGKTPKWILVAGKKP